MDGTCGASVCRATSEALSHLSAIVWSFLAIVAATKAKQIQELVSRIQTALQVLSEKKQN